MSDDQQPAYCQHRGHDLDPRPLTICHHRPKRHVEAVLAQSLLETGHEGRAALAWAWALTGTRSSPMTLSVAKGSPSARDEITAEASAPPSVPTDFCDQLREIRHILLWLTGDTDEDPAWLRGVSDLIRLMTSITKTCKPVT
jgi:hypothetical protein